MSPHNSRCVARTVSIACRSGFRYEASRPMRAPARDDGLTTMAVEPVSRLKVLIVDDEELARLRLRGLVNDNPEPRAEVVGEAANAAQALVQIAERACDVVLLDIQMPGRDGMQLAAELRGMAKPPAVV